ncbi:class IIb bacteriocin, lactobin A/cerein 7B family [Flavobacterium pectinovorum]|nr:class IIb bacteriocin, lactobin A/cerein 7B family [Flavobacterium pectinovorum]
MELAVMNLEDLNLVELNVQEVSEVEGGFFLQWPGIGWYMDCGFSYGYYA